MRTAFLRDLDLILTASFLDWPLYMIGLAMLAAVLAFSAFIFVMVLLGEAFDKFRPAEPKAALEPSPVGNFVFMAAVFSVVWLLVAAAAAAIIQLFATGMAVLVGTLAIATAAASFLIYLIVLGRRVSAQEKPE